MPRIYGKKTGKLSWNDDQMEEAIQSVEAGMALRQAESTHGISKCSI